MTTHHVVFQTQPTANGFTLHNPTVAAPATITFEDGTYTIDFPERQAVDIRISGFSAGGVTYAITAVSSPPGRADVTWSHSGVDALSPAFTEIPTQTVTVTAIASDASATPRQLPPVTTKIRQPGKPDDFLDRFTPQ